MPLAMDRLHTYTICRIGPSYSTNKLLLLSTFPSFLGYCPAKFLHYLYKMSGGTIKTMSNQKHQTKHCQIVLSSKSKTLQQQVYNFTFK